MKTEWLHNGKGFYAMTATLKTAVTSTGSSYSGHLAASTFVSRPVRPNLMVIWQNCRQIIDFVRLKLCTIYYASDDAAQVVGSVGETSLMPPLCLHNLGGVIIIMDQKVLFMTSGTDSWSRMVCFTVRVSKQMQFWHCNRNARYNKTVHFSDSGKMTLGLIDTA